MPTNPHDGACGVSLCVRSPIRGRSKGIHITGGVGLVSIIGGCGVGYAMTTSLLFYKYSAMAA